MRDRNLDVKHKNLSHYQQIVSEVCEKICPQSFPLLINAESASLIVNLLKEIGADDDTVIVSILRAVDEIKKLDNGRIEKIFGISVKLLFKGAQQLDQISTSYSFDTRKNVQFRRGVSLNRMIVAMVDDPRVIVIHLAERLIQLDNSSRLEETDRKIVAKQILAIYAPLANRLGIWRLKWQLEDLALKYLDRSTFDKIAKLLLEKRQEREQYIEKFVKNLQQLMNRSSIQASVNGRVKHIYGIWRKMNRKGVQFDELSDVRAVRILVDDVASCYEALGAVHTAWSQVPEEFDDYIALPKANGYQSIHTAIIGPKSKVVEVQIRTHEMHQNSEFGPSAHWKYKENVGSATFQDEKVQWLRRVLDWRDELAREFDGSENQQEQKAVSEDIYVFTPAGNVVQLPAYSTPIDFAYSIHTEVGHRCRGSIVNGKIVPLTHQLQTGDWVEIKTASRGGPSRDWLSVQQNFVATRRARIRIANWFKREAHGRYQADGKAMLEKEIAKRGFSKGNFEKLANLNGFRRAQDLFVAIGKKELKVAHAIECLNPEKSNEEFAEAIEKSSPRQSVMPSFSFSVLGVESLLTNIASCCGPLPGDEVIGYVTTSRGITIHKRECGNIARMKLQNPERVLAVNWGKETHCAWPTNIEILTDGSSDLLQEVAVLASELGNNITSVNSTKMRKNEVGKVYLTVECHSGKELKKFLSRLNQLPDVLHVRRVND